MKPSDIRSMCCRLRLDLRELRKKSGGFFGSGESTGSVGVVTINMPDVYKRQAVRRPDKEIELKVEDYKCTFGKAAFLKWPIIRGVVSFVDGLVVGTKCLMYSAEIAGDEEDEKEAAKNATLTEEELSAKKAKEAKQFQWLLYLSLIHI